MLGVLQPFANKGNLQLYGWNGKERDFFSRSNTFKLIDLLCYDSQFQYRISNIYIGTCLQPPSHTLSDAKFHVIQHEI